MPARQDPLDLLAERARVVAASAHVPFSEQQEGAALLLSDGVWVPGVRVESASFSLTLPPLLNAYTTAVASKRRDVVAAALSRPLRSEELLFLAEALDTSFEKPTPVTCVRPDINALPPPRVRLDPFLSGDTPVMPQVGVERARRLAQHAYVPYSHFPVGCVLELADGRLLPGVNVEHPDWARTLCAERNAVGTACSYDAPAVHTLYLSCPTDPHGSPCGACRQLLVELAPNTVLWMDRGEAPPEEARPEALLPNAFTLQYRHE